MPWLAVMAPATAASCLTRRQYKGLCCLAQQPVVRFALESKISQANKLIDYAKVANLSVVDLPRSIGSHKSQNVTHGMI